MRYGIEYGEGAQRDLKRLSPEVARRIMRKIERLADGLSGDVKKLRHFSPGYRLRVGDWRVLFDIEVDRIVIQHVSHRSAAYE